RDRRSRLHSVERGTGDEVRAGLAGEVERKVAPDKTGWLPFTRLDRLRPDRVALRLPPPLRVEAQPSTELGHLRSPRYPVDRFPAVLCVERLFGEVLTHA